MKRLEERLQRPNGWPSLRSFSSVNDKQSSPVHDERYVRPKYTQTDTVIFAQILNQYKDSLARWEINMQKFILYCNAIFLQWPTLQIIRFLPLSIFPHPPTYFLVKNQQSLISVYDSPTGNKIKSKLLNNKGLESLLQVAKAYSKHKTNKDYVRQLNWSCGEKDNIVLSYVRVTPGLYFGITSIETI